MHPEIVSRREGRRSERGFALILALLALTLLTFLGLTLSLSTTTELQIATNYRWAEQALRNAEAGIAVARLELQQHDWRAILPPARAAANMVNPPPGVPTRPGFDGLPSRNFEGLQCDPQPWGGNIGYGIVFDININANSYQGANNYGGPAGPQLNGTYTIWIRRPLRQFDPDWDGTGNKPNPNGNEQMVDNETDDQAIITVEGTAPYTVMNANATVRQTQLQNRAVRILETSVRLNPPGCDDNDYAGVGQGATNSGYSGCNPFNDAGEVMGGEANPNDE